MPACPGTARHRDGVQGGRSHRYVRMELPALGERAVSAWYAAGATPGPLYPAILHGRAQRQLLSLAADGDLRGLARSAAPGLRAVGQSLSRPDARQAPARPEVWLDRIATCWHELGERRGIVLFQLAPQHQRDDARLEYLLQRVRSGCG